jgi:hypothetical protein
MEQKSLDSKFLCLLSRGPVPRFWDNTDNNLKKIGMNLGQNEFYSINSHGLRSEEFTKNHDGKHILFAGCSNTFGLGNFLEDVWSYKVYKAIEKNEKVSGYFNVGSPGATISEISYQIFVYCKDYGYPDTVFINLPDYYREYMANLNIYTGKVVPNGQSINKIMITRNVIAQFLSLMDNLALNGTKVISMTWDHEDQTKTNELNAKDYFADMYIVDEKELANHCLSYEEQNKSSMLKDYFLIGLDEDHPGIAVHDFWYLKMYNKYKEINND